MGTKGHKDLWRTVTPAMRTLVRNVLLDTGRPSTNTEIHSVLRIFPKPDMKDQHFQKA